MVTREEAARILASLGVAEVFAESYRTKRLPLNLDIHFGPPEEFFLAPETQDAYTEGRLIPLLDDGNFGVVTFYDPDNNSFVQKAVELPTESLAVFASWQQYLADLFIGIAESDVSDGELEQVAALIGFRHMERTFSFLGNPDDRNWSTRRREFIASL